MELVIGGAKIVSTVTRRYVTCSRSPVNSCRASAGFDVPSAPSTTPTRQCRISKNNRTPCQPATKNDGGAAFGRRAALAAPLLFLSLGSQVPSVAAAEVLGDTEEDIRRSIMLASNVVPALSVEQYKSAIARGKDAAWPQIRTDIDNEDFDQLSNSLLFGPFDEVQQSSFYLPWALLERDVSAAVRAREAYMPLSAAIDNFSEAAAEGAKLNLTAEEVLRSFDTLDSALTAFLKEVP